MISKDLEGIFNGLITESDQNSGILTNGLATNGISIAMNGVGTAAAAAATESKTNNNGEINEKNNDKFKEISQMEMIQNLFLKRFIHFKRNFRLILCVLILPTIFDVIAMGFMKIRPPSEYDKNLMFSTDLYPDSTEFLRWVTIQSV